MLRERGVVGKFVEFFGPGLPNLPLADRATIGNMAPEYGATCGDLPGGRRDAALPRVLRAPARARRAGGGLLPRAGALPRRGLRGRRLLGHARARPGRRGAEPRRPEAPAGPRGAVRRRHRLRGRAGRPGRRRRARAGQPGRGAGGVVPGQRPARSRRRGERRGAAHRPRPRRRGHRRAGAPRGARPRRGGDRGDHELHQHLEPERDARRRACWPRRPWRRGSTRRPWVKTSLAPGSKVVTEYLERAGLLEPLSAARLRPGRLRLHHLHRQLRAAARRDLQGDPGARPGGGQRAVGQPQLRGAHPPRGEDELPGLAAAVRGLRARGADGRGPARASRSRATSTLRDLWPSQTRGQRADGAARSSRTCSGAATARCSRATRAGTRSRCPRATATPGTRTRPTCAARPTSRACPPSRRRASRRSAARGRSPCWATA